MNRIDAIFDQLRQDGSKTLIPFLAAGDPDLPTTARLLTATQEAGVRVCEIGIPFSDPIADGPVIQASMTHALNQGVQPKAVLEMIAKLRPSLDMALVVMVSYSIVYRMGVDSFMAQSREAGVDGVILPDLPLEESAPARAAAAKQNLTFSLLIAPTTPTDRAQQIAKASTGFIYLLSRAGITGERAEIAQDLPQRVESLRKVTSLPIAVGFGVSDRQQVRQVVRTADAAIVGSAIMRRVAQCRDQGPDAVVDQVSRFVADLAQGAAADPSPTP